MSVQFLISCMHEEISSFILKRRWDKYNYVIVNQTNVDNEIVQKKDKSHVIVFSSDRGLSNSRNRAIDEASGDICVLCDNDGIPVENADKIIEVAYEKVPDADIIVFDETKKNFGEKIKKLNKLSILKVSSTEITFNRERIKGKIVFNPNLGAGTSIGSGEENMFLMDAKKKSMRIYYYPQKIMSWPEELYTPSTWNLGMDKQYFYNRGRAMQYVLGRRVGLLYCFYFITTKRKLYKDKCGSWRALQSFIKGLYSNMDEQK